MAASDREKIGQGLELLARGLAPWVDRRMTETNGRDWLAEFGRRDAERFGHRREHSLNDVRLLLRVITENRETFKPVLPRPGLSLASEIREIGNSYAHDFSPESFTPVATAEALAVMARLLRLAGARQAADVEALARGGAPGDGPANGPADGGADGGAPGYGSAGPAAAGGAPGAGPAGARRGGAGWAGGGRAGGGRAGGGRAGGGPAGGWSSGGGQAGGGRTRGARPGAMGGPPPRTPPYPPPRMPPPVRPPFRPGAPRTGIAGVPVPAVIAGGGCLLMVAVLVVVLVVGALASNSGSDSGSGSGSNAKPTGKPTHKYAGVKDGTKLGEYTGVDLAKDYQITSFLDDPKHPEKGSLGDLNYSDYGLISNNEKGKFALLDPGDRGGYQACRDDTRYETVLPIDRIKGRSICVTNEDGVIALVRVTDTGQEPSEYVRLDLTVWKGPKPR
ncbi:Swt1 family HEPN domain-containing protein [Actinomadura atramentaria]|uniref:Swt1 family HEPN domain-containing protein n=1 Tax=Actinomadura atramentaria TaxID=1990 RepID=UPI0003A4A659|nr:Swt1 family HEPN domain-containing protein [Actinomadura atramentaria]